jgi:hypothetical protein
VPPACGLRARDARDVVLRLRPGEAPILAPDVGALCLELTAGDPVPTVAAALAELARTGLPVRCRPPEIVFDADGEWLARVAELPWAVVYARHLALIAAGPDTTLAYEYPLQGLNGLTPGVLAELAGAPPAAVVVSPEAALDEVVALAVGLAHLDPAPAIEALAFGRQQVLHARDRLGREEGVVAPPDAAGHAGLLLEDAKGYVFPAQVGDGGTRLFNARLTNLAGNLDELRAVGVARFLVVQRDLSPDERRAFASGGLQALAAFVSRERTTTGHLFRGVA